MLLRCRGIHIWEGILAGANTDRSYLIKYFIEVSAFFILLALECKVISLTEEFNETRVVAEIVNMSVDESVLTGGKVDLDKVHPIMFDSSALCYREIGASVGGAWDVGKKQM